MIVPVTSSTDQAGAERAFGFVVWQHDPLRAAVMAGDDLPDVAAELEQRHRDLAGRDAFIAAVVVDDLVDLLDAGDGVIELDPLHLAHRLHDPRREAPGRSPG